MSCEGLRQQLWSGSPINYVSRSGEQVLSQCQVSGGGKRKIHLSKSALHIACLTLKSKSRGLGLSCTFRLLYMPYQTGKGIRYLISRKKEIKFSFLLKRIFFSSKYHFSFLFGIFVAVLSLWHWLLLMLLTNWPGFNPAHPQRWLQVS